MSMSTHVTGFRPPDEKWRQMKAVWDANEAAGLEHPKELWDFFGHDDPDEAGIEVDIKDAIEKCGGDSTDGYQIELAKLPDNVTHIRFENCW